MGSGENFGDDCENIGLGCALEAFREVEEVESMMASLLEVSDDERKKEQLVERWKYVLDLYQEQPHLLDPHLPHIMDRLVGLIRTHQLQHQLHTASQLLAHVIKVRGFKIVVRHFPHEVEDLELVVGLLHQEATAASTHNWEARYVLLLWLSIIVLIPFNMARFDSGERSPLADRILFLCKGQLATTDKSRDAAAFLASKFLTRPDARESALPTFLDWALVTSTAESTLDSEVMGGLMALCSVVKHGKREDLVAYAEPVLRRLLGSSCQEHANTAIRRYYLKLVQRLGLIFLRSRVATWRYQRGSRSITLNLRLQSDNSESQTAAKPEEEQEEDYEDVPEVIEEVLDELLRGLKDKETIVRWTAAKGIGRVTGRLPRDLADEVVGSLLELFSERETDSAWHGACLSIAELGRRGLLLPHRLPQVVELVMKALVYDERRGSFSVGSHIRDAACYVCWSFARAYEPDLLKPYVNTIASGLLVVTVFDREVNCRRAASAAFQENVGRQGTFPHGIDILTTADYFAVGQRSNAYLNVSVFIASFPEYTQALVEHLVTRKVGHWDPAVRDLTAKALNRLTACDRDYMMANVLPRLLNAAISVDLYASHGATLATGQVVLALALAAEEAAGRDKLLTAGQLLEKAGLFTRVEELADRFIAGNKLRGLGGELMRQAAAEFIANCSRARLPVSRSVVATWRQIIDENLSNAEMRVQLATVEAVPDFMSQYYLTETGEALETERDSLVRDYTTMLRGQEQQRKGFALALGAMPVSLLGGMEEEVLSALIACSKITEGTEKWAEARRDAISGLSSLAVRLCGRLDQEMILHVYDAFLLSLEDYTLDRRGDVGAWVREAALSGIEALTLALLRCDTNKIPSSVVAQFMPLLVQQAVEKIDRTRGHAGRIFYTLLHAAAPDGRPLAGIKSREELTAIFPPGAEIKWSAESETFPRFVRLLGLPDYSGRLLLGLIVSVGGITERLVKNSSQSLFGQLGATGPDGLRRFCDDLLDIFRRYQKEDRVTYPLFKFLDQMLTAPCIESVLKDSSSTFPLTLFSLCKTEVARCGDPNKLMASSDVFCQLLQSEDPLTCRKCLVQVAIFLCHKFPRVRKYTADKFYEALLTYSDKDIIPEEHLDEVMSLLSETAWDKSIEELKTVRNRICELAGVPAPALLKKTAEE